MPVGIEAWVFQIPPITRGWLALSVLTSLAVVGTVQSNSPRKLSLTMPSAMSAGYHTAALLQPEKCI